jgi:hypothetical protein
MIKVALATALAIFVYCVLITLKNKLIITLEKRKATRLQENHRESNRQQFEAKGWRVVK